MKKEYESPVADSLVFRPVESLAIKWEDLQGGQYGQADSDVTDAVSTDIKINIKK